MMMKHKLIKNIRIVDDGKEFISDVYIKGERIEKIASNISLSPTLAFDEINGEELLLMPGMIDAHVHFREPGLTYKGNMSSESAAAVAGGITSIMDMPNTVPSVLSVDVLEQKYEIASNSSLANYSFFMGLSKDNLDEALKVSTEDVCGLTDDGLYFDEAHPTLCNSLDYLEKIFSSSEHLIALHSENDYLIKKNYDNARNKFKEFIPPYYHSIIRSSEVCYTSTKEIVDLAKKHNTRFHLLHVSTGAEAKLFHIDVVKKSSNGVADLYRIKERGYIREGYFADLVLVDLNKKYRVTEENIKYKCSWSPFLDYTFHASINSVFVNGQIVFNDDVVIASQCGKRLKFEKIR